MKKLIAFLLVFSLLFSPLFAAATTTTTDADEMTEAEREQFKVSFGYDPYGSSEFPDWLHKLRRVEVITLGATALTFPILNAALGSVKFSDNDTKDFLAKFGISAGAGLVIAIIDLIIGEFVKEAVGE